MEHTQSEVYKHLPGIMGPLTCSHVDSDLVLKKQCAEGSLNQTRAAHCSSQKTESNSKPLISVVMAVKTITRPFSTRAFHFHFFPSSCHIFSSCLTLISCRDKVISSCSFAAVFTCLKNSMRLFFWHCKILDMFILFGKICFAWELWKHSKDWETL